MNIFLTRKKTLLKHKKKSNLIVWFEGDSFRDSFSAKVVSKNEFYKFNYFSKDWNKNDFEPLNKKTKT